MAFYLGDHNQSLTFSILLSDNTLNSNIVYISVNYNTKISIAQPFERYIFIMPYC